MSRKRLQVCLHLNCRARRHLRIRPLFYCLLKNSTIVCFNTYLLFSIFGFQADQSNHLVSQPPSMYRIWYVRSFLLVIAWHCLLLVDVSGKYEAEVEIDFKMFNYLLLFQKEKHGILASIHTDRNNGKGNQSVRSVENSWMGINCF